MFLSALVSNVVTGVVPLKSSSVTATKHHSPQQELSKKLCYRKRTARRDVSVKILPTAAWQCRNDLYNNSRTNRSNGVRGLQSTNVWKTCQFSHDALDRRRYNPQADRRRVCWSQQYTDDLLWRSFLSPKCTHVTKPTLLVTTRLILHTTNPCTKFVVSSISRSGYISRVVKF